MPYTARHLRTCDTHLETRSVKLVAVSLAGVLLLGVAAATAQEPPRPTPPQQVTAVRLTAVSPLRAATTPARPVVTPTSVPRRTPKKVAPRAVRAAPKKVDRWLPTGTGMWLHEFARSEGGSARAVVARARRAGLTSLYVQTGSSTKGWIGTPTLRALLPATKGTGVKVIAWDFPTLRNPEADAMRMARAARFHCGGCPRVAAVAPDVETSAEGTEISDAAVARYYSRLRRALPADIAILATVPWPSEKRTGRYPYARTASLADALVPMAYWYNRSPAGVTASSMAYLQRFGKPVMPVGQGYDSRIDAPHLAADPDPGGSVAAFLRTADRRGARAVSLWSWQTTGAHQWAALARGQGLFRPAPRETDRR